jgi:hypothetical protein
VLPVAPGGILREGRFAGLFVAIGLGLYALALRDDYFFFDDFYFLDQVARRPLVALLAPQPEFHWRPLSQYGFFGLGHALFGAWAGGYYWLDLAVLAGVAALALPVARFAGFAPAEARIGCALLVLSAAFYRCAAWLSSVQHSLYVLLVLAVLVFEIRWLERRRLLDKALAVVCFGLGLAANAAAVLALPLLAVAYLYHARRCAFAQRRALLGGFLATALPCALLLAGWFVVYAASPAYAPARAGVSDPSHPYFLRITPGQALDNALFLARALFPYGPATLPALGLVVAAFALRRLRTPDGERTPLAPAGFAALFGLVAVAPFLFLVNRRDPSMALLAGVLVLPWLASWLLAAAAPPRRTGAARLAWLPAAAGALVLALHLAFIAIVLGRPGNGRDQAEGIARMNDLAKSHFPAASRLLLVREPTARARAGAPDWVWISYGYGHIPPVLVEGREVEFVREEVEARLAAAGDDTGVIRYRDDFRFFVHPTTRPAAAAPRSRRPTARRRAGRRPGSCGAAAKRAAGACGPRSPGSSGSARAGGRARGEPPG